MSKRRFLMCPPDHYGVKYVINPWMEGNKSRARADVAREQWQAFHKVLASRADVDLLDPRPGVPDLPFTANAGLVMGKRVVLSRFRYPERQKEEPHYEESFRRNEFEIIKPPATTYFEGAGDALFDRGADRLWMAYGWRSVLEASEFVAARLGVEAIPLRLVDERFYHLDTCFCPLAGGYTIYYPPAFDERSRRLVEELIPADRRHAVSERDAMHFACNAVDTGDAVVLNTCTEELETVLRGWGFEVIRTPLTEFILSGGSAKCLSLRLDETGAQPARKAQPEGVRRRVFIKGHLLDTGLLTQAMDAITEPGGSFEIADLRAGLRRDDLSEIRLEVSALTAHQLQHILARLVDLGAELERPETANAVLKACERDGCAPEGFYCTTIFPTDVCIDGSWIRVENQRMDGTIRVSKGGQSPRAEVVLMRDLREGELVVTGAEGIRTHTRKEQREEKGEFGFMSSQVSTERRVELAVDAVAWEMLQVRKRGGRIVIVAGPVVVHTGGVEYLCELVRERFCSALLGGNAIAVHDMEYALFGTSLGVDLDRGATVRGGHHHHLRTINMIRQYGSIDEAVRQGVLKRGLMYELSRMGVPYCLAGSIRDDGPLPETEMDLIRAQEKYRDLLRGADLVLMLSSMLHAIGVGNMTPAGVKLVCVDINTSVATKLADRGSLESIPVVTDVGLFLSLLARKIRDLQMEPHREPGV